LAKHILSFKPVQTKFHVHNIEVTFEQSFYYIKNKNDMHGMVFVTLTNGLFGRACSGSSSPEAL